jgi:acyl carrier protein
VNVLEQHYVLLNEIMHTALGRPDIYWRPDTRLGDIENWNSNKTVTTALALEKRLGRSLPMEALDQITTVAELALWAKGDAASVHAVSAGNYPLFAAFESLGESCEFGILQQYEGVMQPHLLRFSSFTGDPAQRLNRLVAGLEDDFLRLAEPKLLDIFAPETEWDNAAPEYRVVNTHYGLQIHTGFLVSEMDLAGAKQRLKDFPNTLTFLRNRLLHKLRTGGKRWLWKSAILSPHYEVEALLEVLQKHGSNTLLWVKPAEEGHAAGTVHELKPNLFAGYIWKSGDAWAGDWSDGEAWLALLKSAEAELPEVLAPAAEAPSPQAASSQDATDQAYQLLNEIVAAQLETPELILHPDMRPEHVDGWDSLKHINIILEVEGRLGIIFQQEELEQMLNAGDFVALIARHLPTPEPRAPAAETAPAGGSFLALRLPKTPDSGAVTAIVSGLGQAGCSLVAEILNALGMAIHSAPGRDNFPAALDGLKTDLVKTFIARRNRGAKPWGVMLPALAHQLAPRHLEIFRQPRVVMVMQDPVAVANEGPYPTQAYFAAAQAGAEITQFVEQAQCPALLLSHENILAAPEANLAMLAKFCGLAPSAQQRAAALALILAAV